MVSDVTHGALDPGAEQVCFLLRVSSLHLYEVEVGGRAYLLDKHLARLWVLWDCSRWLAARHVRGGEILCGLNWRCLLLFLWSRRIHRVRRFRFRFLLA